MNRILHKLSIKRIAFLLILAMSCTSAFSTKPFSRPPAVQVKIVKCFPNPATTVVNFELQALSEKNAVIQIYTFSGKKVKDVPVSSGKITVMLDNDFYRGIYIFQLKDKNGRILESGKFQVVK